MLHVILPTDRARGYRESPRRTKYLAVPGFPLYRVGTNGSVWSFASGTWLLLKPHRAGRRRDRPRVTLYKDRRGQKFFVHQLVLLAFVGPCPPGKVASHRDDDPTNNALSNLAYKTHCENMRDAVNNGKIRRGEQCPHARLKDAQIPAIFALREAGWTFRRIAACFGVGTNTVQAVVYGRTWRHVRPWHGN